MRVFCIFGYGERKATGPLPDTYVPAVSPDRTIPPLGDALVGGRAKQGKSDQVLWIVSHCICTDLQGPGLLFPLNHRSRSASITSGFSDRVQIR